MASVQSNKSSLRVRTMQRLQGEGTVCVLIDLTEMGKQDMTPEKWYGGIVQYLVSGCELSSIIQWRTWWRERRDLLSPVQRLSLFIIKEVLNRGSIVDDGVTELNFLDSTNKRLH